MFVDTDTPNRRFPSLVQYCQRVAINHVDSISGFGDDLRYELIKPILEHCSAEQLLRLEQASPHLRSHTPEIWKDMCFQSYPLIMERYPGDGDEPESWSQLFFDIRAAEARRLEELGNRLRAKRIMADNEKKEREVKLTTKLPPSKRRRTGLSSNSQPKTLFQKTRMEASRIQKSIFTGAAVPGRQGVKDYRVLHNTHSAKMVPQPTTTDAPNRVAVNTVFLRNSSTKSPSSSASSSDSSLSSSPTKPCKVFDSSTAKISVVSQPTRLPPPIPAAAKSRKNDPMAGLFMPKHRAHSQLPGATPTIVSR